MKERIFKLKEYTYDELSDTAKDKAYECFLKEFEYGRSILDFYAEDLNKTMKEFGRIFGVAYTDWELDYRGYFKEGKLCYNPYSVWYNYESDVYNEQLKGARLMAFLWNNFGDCIEKGRIYWKPHNHKSRYSKVIMSRDCVLTGVYYDGIILAPIYDFLDGKGDMNRTAHELFEECYYDLLKAFAEECENFWTEENFIENFADDTTYNEDGTPFETPNNGIEL